MIQRTGAGMGPGVVSPTADAPADGSRDHDDTLPAALVAATVDTAPASLNNKNEHFQNQEQFPEQKETMTPTIVTPAEPATPTSPTQRAATGDRQAPWPEHPRHFLERVKETVSKAELGNLLSKGSDPFHLAVLRIHMESFDFRRDPIDLALRLGLR
ncbi:hypothetical protein BGZ99_009937 [Dissophora globulifera]|uniref:SEC7 domain-containing protein n=1 Tax=Dissophora globulifera TaxID=979702 RepID=A0A9P6R3J4_9FUNG|nr:hypothetical protein BGZ99_009937 [Dissophora globulifera]